MVKKNIKLIFNLKNSETISIQLESPEGIMYEETLTTGQGFDILLITAIDKLLRRNSINKLSLGDAVLTGKIDEKAVYGMILKAVKAGLREVN